MRELTFNLDMQNMIRVYLPDETLKSFKKDLGKAVRDVKVRRNA